jgi:hypothetical protein
MRSLFLIMFLQLITHPQSAIAADSKFCRDNERVFAVAYGQRNHEDYVFKDTDKFHALAWRAASSAGLLALGSPGLCY